MIFDSPTLLFIASTAIITVAFVLYRLRAISTLVLETTRLSDALDFNRTILIDSPLPMGVYAATGECVLVNEALAQLVGASRETLQAQNFNTISSWKESGLLDECLIALEHHCRRAREIQIVTSFGKMLWVECRILPTSINSQPHLLLQLIDLTERKHFESQLRDSEARYARVIRGTSDGFWDWDIQTGSDYHSPRYKEMLGYADDEYENTEGAFDAIVHPDDLPRVHAAQQAHLQRREPYDTQLRLRCKSGEYRWFRSRGQAEWDATGQPLRMAGSLTDITERKQAEEALKASEAKFSLAFMSSPLAMIITRITDGRILEVNPAFESMVGYSRVEAVGKTTPDLSLWENSAARQHFYADLLEHGGVDQCEYRFQRKNGTILIGLLSARVFILNHEQLVLGSISDITARKEMEEALRESEFRWKFAIEGGGDGVWDWNAETDEVKYSRRWKTMLGYEEDEIKDLNQEWVDRIHPDDKDYVAGTMQAYLDQEIDAYVVEYRLRCKDGNYKWILGRGTAVNRSEDGRVLRMIGTHTDITERKKAEESLHLTQYSIDHITDSIVWIDKNAKYHFVNDAACRMFGYSREELLTMGVFDIDPIFPKDQWAQHWQDIIERGSFTIETVQKAKDGREFPVEVTVNFVEYNGQQYNCAVIHDITQRKQSEEQLKESEERFRNIFIHAPVGIFHSIPSGRFLIANPALAGMLGYASPEELMAAIADMSVQLYVDPAVRPQIVEKMLRTEGWIHRDAVLWRRRDGRIITVDMTGRKVLDSKGKVAYLEGIVEDITERKQTEEALVVAKQTAEAASRAKGEFLANMSHEIRTPMNAILGMAYLALQTPLDARQRDYVAKIHASAESLLGIINDILDFSKIEAGKLELEFIPFALSAVFDHLATVIGGKASDKGLTIRFALSEEVPAMLLGDSLRLQQIMDNLANNAVKFTEQGQVVIAVEPAGAMENGVIPLTFSVSDTGIGMDPAQMQRILEPFTQADSSVTRRYGGTGLGLSIVTRLLELMGSRLEIVSEPGQGSRFAFTLRLAIADDTLEPGRRRHDPTLAEALQRLRGARVLVVEDNRINQQVAREIIEQAGLQVQVAANGRLAVEALRHAADFDAVFMDIQMPEMDGYEATRCIREFKTAAELPIIAMTAHALQDEREKCLAAGMNDHLAKPIMPGEVQAALVRWIPPKLEAAAATLLTTAAVHPGELPAILPGLGLDLDVAMGLQRASGNAMLYRQILSEFREQHQTVVSELTRELGNHNLERASAIVHSLKGLAGTIGARALFATASTLEAEVRKGSDGSRWLATLKTQMDDVLETIATLETAAPDPVPAPPPPLPLDALPPLFNELQGMLQNNNLAAIPLFNQLKAQLDLSPELEEMDRQIARLHFAQALDQLAALAVQYGIQR